MFHLDEKFWDYPINRNMRCIEIADGLLILIIKMMINRNMRCIEMDKNTQELLNQNRINRNMRCIEMLLMFLLGVLALGLIET